MADDKFPEGDDDEEDDEAQLSSDIIGAPAVSLRSQECAPTRAHRLSWFF